MINVDVSKSSHEHTIKLVCGDRRTSRIRIRINRYADGVDLSGLAWSVSYKNSAGAGNTDVICVVDVCGSDLRFEWTIPDAVSAVSGISQFFVFGTDGNRKWQSDIMRINVADAMTAPAEYDEESASELDVLISNATVKVNELVSEYENIIDRIDNVIDEADTRITEVINDINSRIESGEFKGEDGNDGYTPVKNIDYFDGEDGYTPVIGIDYFTDADKQSMVSEVNELVQQYINELNADLDDLRDDIDGKAELTDIPDISGKIDKPSDTPTVGKILRVKSVNADGTFVCEWADDEKGIELSDIPKAGNGVLGL